MNMPDKRRSLNALIATYKDTSQRIAQNVTYLCDSAREKKGETQCYNCKEFGHISKDCQQCKEFIHFRKKTTN
jgi:hypothetical protein